MMLPSGREEMSTDWIPISICCIRVLMSRMSVALCCISSSPMEANISAYMLHTFSMAYSLFTLSFLIEFSISPVSMGSARSIICPCMISASFSPTLVARSSASFSVAFMVSSSAPLKRCTSSSTSVTACMAITSRISSTITAFPIPIPAEALVPLYLILYLLIKIHLYSQPLVAVNLLA